MENASPQPGDNASPRPNVFEWLAVHLLAGLLPSLIFVVVVAAGLGDFNFVDALKSAALIYIPSSIYFGVWGDMILVERLPSRGRFLLGVVLFACIIAAMVAGLCLADSSAFRRPGIWTGLQLIIVVVIMIHAAFEKSVLMEHDSNGTEPLNRASS
jgi:hypothetical protein